jgi:hypothetical protein
VSQLASFYKLPADRFDDLVAAATPRVVTVEKRRLLFLKTRTRETVDDFWAFLSQVASRGEACPYPGGVFLDLDILQEAHGLRLFELARRDLSEQLSRARDLLTVRADRPAWMARFRSRIPVFDHDTANAAREKLAAHPLAEQEVRAHAREEYGVDDEGVATATILAGFELTKRWLGCVRPGEIAFRTVG